MNIGTYLDVAILMCHVFLFTLVAGMSIVDGVQRNRQLKSDEPIYVEALTVGLLISTIMHSILCGLRSLFNYTGEFSLYFAFIAAAAWKGKRDERRHQQRKMR